MPDAREEMVAGRGRGKGGGTGSIRLKINKADATMVEGKMLGVDRSVQSAIIAC